MDGHRAKVSGGKSAISFRRKQTVNFFGHHEKQDMMKIKAICLIAVPISLVLIASSFLMAGTVPEAFKEVETLRIEKNGYVLGAALTGEQKKTALANPAEGATAGTYKFTDNGLNIVTDPSTDRVLIIYEQLTDVTGKKARELTGTLFMEFDEPTVSAHDKVVYWAYGKKGKYSSREYDKSKEDKKKLEIIATIKLSSEMKLMDKAEQGKGTVYYIISSAPLLKLIQDTNS